MLPETETADGFAPALPVTLTVKALAAGIPPAAVSSASSKTIASDVPFTVALETAGGVRRKGFYCW